MRNNASGRFSLQINGSGIHTYNLRSDQVQCEIFVDYYLTQGTHNLTLRLEGADTNRTVSEGRVTGQASVLHLTEILYYQTNTSTASSVASSSLSSSSHKGAIVGGIVGGVVFIAIVLAALAFTKKKQSGPFGRGRHAFDPTRPTSSYITELSPRSPQSESGFGDVKFASPYARMDDDDYKARDVKSTIDFSSPTTRDFKIDALAVPTLAYTSGQGERGPVSPFFVLPGMDRSMRVLAAMHDVRLLGLCINTIRISYFCIPSHFTFLLYI
ncbi:hypothetical protein BDY19DRAFT_1066550 [Irpex rosettiformis]|uniref:Uncharacterized protein n=1 Tax=Irpex rosettiformis TaxID=378272 RepID=A0ACB8UDK3_9APHY|nr:hypothetical protein BDY19DRAFT_1066550 [Irpex rosettiformis]